MLLFWRNFRLNQTHQPHYASLCAGSLEAYKQSLSAAPQCAAVHCNKAAALAKLERHEEAIAAARQAMALNKDYAKVKLQEHLQ